MSRNISKEDLKTMCVCRLHVTPGQTYTCPVDGEITNDGVLTNPVVNGLKIGLTPGGAYCLEKKTGQGWGRRDDQEFLIKSDAMAYLLEREILFRVFS